MLALSSARRVSRLILLSAFVLSSLHACADPLSPGESGGAAGADDDVNGGGRRSGGRSSGGAKTSSGGLEGLAGGDGDGGRSVGGKGGDSGGAPGIGGGAGGTPEVVDAPFVVSGSRLKAEYFVAQGARSFVHLYDTQLKVGCEFDTIAGEEGLHCVPEYFFSGYFADDDCSRPVFPRYFECEEDEYFRLPSRDANGNIEAGIVPYKRGALVQASELYTLTSDGCLSVGSAPNEVFSLVPVPASEFVAGYTVNEPAGGDVWVRRVHAEDGTKIVETTTDADGDVCQIVGDRCVPMPFAYLSASFTDNECTERGADNPFSRLPLYEGERPRYALVPGICKIESILEVEEGPLVRQYRKSGDVCEAIEPFIEFFSVGSTPVNEELPEIVEVRTGQSTRSVKYTSSVGVTVGLVSGFETADRVPCAIRATTTSGLRCIPSPLSLSSPARFFRDDQCVEPLYDYYNSGCEADPLSHWIVEAPVSGEVCSENTVAEVYFAVPHEGPVYELNNEGDCWEYPQHESWLYFRKGDSIPLDSFPEVTTERDP